MTDEIFTTVFDEEESVKASPVGARGILKIDDQNVDYWKPIDGLYELWLDESLVGYTEELEVEVADTTSSFARRLAEKHVKYNSVVLGPKGKRKTHDSFEIGLRWIYQESL